MMQKYFDNGSTSWPKAPGVEEAMSRFLKHGAFNINRGNYMGAYDVEAEVLDTRERLAAFFGGEKAEQVIFTPGITYSLNAFIKGTLKKGDRVLVSGVEHNAVMRPLRQMEAYGIEIGIMATDEEGSLCPETAEKAITPATKAMIVSQASNVCGTVLPIEALGRLCRKHGILFAVDSAQGAGSLDIHMEDMNIDFLAFTAHKGLLGPQGIGGFLLSERLSREMLPLIAGGTGSSSDSFDMPDILPDRYESGTMNLPGIMGLNAALRFLEKGDMQEQYKKKMALTMAFIEGVREIGGVRILGKKSDEDRVAVVSLDFEGGDNAIAAFALEQKYGIMTRVGLHCAPLAHKSLGTFPRGTVRFSFGEFNSPEEIKEGIEAIRDVAKECI